MRVNVMIEVESIAVLPRVAEESQDIGERIGWEFEEEIQAVEEMMGFVLALRFLLRFYVHLYF